MINEMASPPRLQPKQWYRPFFGETVKDGVLSEWNGHSPTKDVPLLARLT